MFKKHSRPISRVSKHYWFTITAANNQTLATSETYTTSAMRDKGIEAVKRTVLNTLGIQYKGNNEWAGTMAWAKQAKDYKLAPKSRKPSDTFHIENKKGKIVKR